MTKDQASAAFQELMRFGKEHSRATLLLRVAAHDYAAARCLLFNGMFEGLVMGAQAIEKCLKAYLILDDPQRQVKALQHSPPKLLTEASVLFPRLSLQNFAPLVEKFRRHYQATADLRELDKIIIFLTENMPCPHIVKYLAGIYPLITFSLGYNGTVTTWESWIKNDNHALLPLLPRIASEHEAVMKAPLPLGSLPPLYDVGHRPLG
jgi:HEPN domain-containing protein